MNFFSSDGFLQVVGDVFYASAKRGMANVQVGEHVFRLLMADDTPVLRAPFLDFFEPLAQGPVQATAPFLPRVSHGVVTARAYADDGLANVYEPAPYIDWNVVGSWDEFLAYVHERSPHPYKANERKKKKIARELGELRIEERHTDIAVIEQAMQWKSAQYKSTGLWDLFAQERTRRLFLEMTARGLLHVTALYAGERLLAVHAGPVYHGRFYYWVPAHDPSTNNYSPGTLLLEHLIERAFQARWQFDFLLGGEPYKWHFATHTRLVGAQGQEALQHRLIKSVRALAMHGIRQQPQLYELLQNMKKRLLERGVL